MRSWQAAGNTQRVPARQHSRNNHTQVCALKSKALSAQQRRVRTHRLRQPTQHTAAEKKKSDGNAGRLATGNRKRTISEISRRVRAPSGAEVERGASSSSLSPPAAQARTGAAAGAESTRVAPPTPPSARAAPPTPIETRENKANKHRNKIDTFERIENAYAPLAS